MVSFVFSTVQCFALLQSPRPRLASPQPSESGTTALASPAGFEAMETSYFTHRFEDPVRSLWDAEFNQIKGTTRATVYSAQLQAQTGRIAVLVNIRSPTERTSLACATMDGFDDKKWRFRLDLRRRGQIVQSKPLRPVRSKHAFCYLTLESTVAVNATLGHERPQSVRASLSLCYNKVGAALSQALWQCQQRAQATGAREVAVDMVRRAESRAAGYAEPRGKPSPLQCRAALRSEPALMLSRAEHRVSCYASHAKSRAICYAEPRREPRSRYAEPCRDRASRFAEPCR